MLIAETETVAPKHRRDVSFVEEPSGGVGLPTAAAHRTCQTHKAEAEEGESGGFGHHRAGIIHGSAKFEGNPGGADELPLAREYVKCRRAREVA